MKQYVLIREDLNPAQQAVQAGHALAQFMLEHPEEAARWRNRTLIYLGVPTEHHLWRYKTMLERQRRPVSGFIEPDIGHELTAVATSHRLSQFNRLGLCCFKSTPQVRTLKPFQAVS